MNTPFEVTVTGEHCPDGQIAFFDRFFDRFRQWTGVTDTGGATISHQIEAELVEVRRQAGMGQIIRHHFRAWGQGSFHPRLRLQAAFDGFFRQQAGGHQHAGVRGIGAGGNRCNSHRAIR